MFLPNFPVSRILHDDPSILTSNKIVGNSGYWFFRHIPDAEVEVLDNTSPFPFGWLSSKSKIEFFQAFRALLAQRDYDLVISHSFNAGFVFGFLRSLLSHKNPPHFVIDVGSLNGGRRNRIQIAIVRFALKSVAGIIYHSTANEDFYSTCFPNLNREYIPFGVDTELFKPFAYEPSNDFILSIGSTKRDYATLTNAWRRIDFPLRIVGSKKLSLDGMPNVQLMDRVPINKLMKMIHDSRFVVLPLQNVRYSVGQMTLLQCMAMRKVVVVTNVIGASDYCTDDDNCITVRVRSPSDIIEKVDLLLRDTNRTERIAANARESVSSRFSERGMALRMLDFIKRTISIKVSN